jgi:glucose-1-phosphate cytidylyltransferase
MQAVILAGGLGTRMGHEVSSLPKPMVRVGSYPIIWHIMKILHSQGVDDFVICAGHKGDVIREYFLNYPIYRSNLTLTYDQDGTKTKLVPMSGLEDWTVNVVETGEDTPTGGRLLAVKDFVRDKNFIVTYGDGLANVDISQVLNAHIQNRSTLTLSVASGKVVSFEEKPQGKDFVNIGYMVASQEIFQFLKADSIFEQEPVRKVLAEGKLSAVPHGGFWQPMDTPTELSQLNELWKTGSPPWRV